ncbi:PREDICTED: serine-rich adhesin for platelets [Dufourea novaeangliae]|uniref:serine-rich adhesin for platelets n=1 Tax=Dufourea novaeangliae TaxID=178035 RepID=UPI000767D2E9|nr:PREDICTED: serine-rich adhesin for platelets [Dufourea novaeangliae]XP_015428909.1 PREDICTED: serine-rich adhesin for platelets [Dufourea novaeangliae]
MEQIDEVQNNTVEVQSVPVIDLSSAESESNEDVTIIGNIPEDQENCSKDYTDNVMEAPFSKNECDLNILVRKVDIDEEEIMKNVDANVTSELHRETVNNDIEEAAQAGTQEKVNNDTEADNDHSVQNVVKTEKKQTTVSIDAEDIEKCADKESSNKDDFIDSNDDRELSTDKNKYQNLEKDVCTVIDINTTDDTNTQCQTLIKSLSQTFENKDQSLHVADTETDLTKLVDDNSEVMVVTVETVPLNDSNEAPKEKIVVTMHEKDILVNANKNDLSQKEKETEKNKIINEQFDLIEYSQETDGTIIEVISTEVIQSEVSKACTQEDNELISKLTTSGIDLVTSTTSEVATSSQIIGTDVIINEDKIKSTGTDKLGENDTEAQLDNDIKTGTCDHSNRSNVKKEPDDIKVNIPTNVDNSKKECKINKVNKSVSTTNKRSVIQDIFDDWGDENAEEDNQSISKEHDTVEIELKSLLDDTRSSQAVEEDTILILNEESIEKGDTDTGKTVKVIKGNKEVQISKEQADNNQSVKKQQRFVKSLKKDPVNFTVSQNFGKSVKHTTHDSITFSQTSSQAKIIPLANRGRNLTSQIASPAEVTEALKERLREKQKIVEAPPGPDIFFVKKLTQRLSSKLAGGPMSTLPALIPLPQPSIQSCTPTDKKTTENISTDANKDTSKEINTQTTEADNKESNSDNKELLAILEGDVDPDWSNLKPPTLTEEGKGPVNVEETGPNTPPKLDPLVERELALKQLLELPIIPVKKAASRKKKTFKSAPGKTAKDIEGKSPEVTKEIVSIDLADDSTEPILNNTRPDTGTSPVIIENTLEKSVESASRELRIDESRSGRKRKLTEKAREHEEQLSIVKRQKVYKSKVSLNKKQPLENEVQPPANTSLTTENDVLKESIAPAETVSNEADVTITKEIINKELTSEIDLTSNKPEAIPVKRPKQSLSKKGSQSIPKRSMVVKKILKQNMSSGKKVALKTKLSTSSKKSASKVTSKSKQSTQSSSGDSKPKKKPINEIDRLLQDEGVVNLLYDVEQPDKKRLIPITKSQAKVMDIQKVQRELNFRKKLVRSAVLRLRTATTGVSKVSPRSKRTTIHGSDIQTDKKVGEQAATVKSNATPQQEFILPAKIRNAADASVIIRRHSSSSFSSASGSPRVSIDSPEKIEGTKNDEAGSHSLRSTKRRLSDEGTNAKKSKKKVVHKGDIESMVANSVDDKAVRPTKKSDSKKGDKNSKHADATITEETSSGKVITRSNGTTTGNANIAKILELDNSKTKTESRNQFSNKEINVRRHGNLVQLILTPSSSTKLRNALTLQMMQEFRETLSILKKDDDCRVVLLTSTGSSFCEGLELSMLLHTNTEERRIQAQEMADAVKDFIKSLATFNKPIVAGVQGAAVGLGVTMLPLFDLVIASDKATFSTPYGKLGQIAEGAAVFTLSHILGSAITSELLLGGRTLTASEALRAGLVTRVLWPDRFQVELLPTLKAMSEQSSQSMEATKALLRHSLRKKLDAALESETYLLIQHWCSTECQTAIKAYMDGKVQ